MTLNVLIIDDNEHFRHLLSRNLLLGRPDANIHEYDPLPQGKPDDKFDWSVYDLVFLDYKIGDENGIEWLRDFRRIRNFPKTIFLVTDKFQDVGRMACEIGADGYISKSNLTRNKLKELVGSVLTSADNGDSDRIVIDFKTSCPSSAIKDYEILQQINHSQNSSIFLARRPCDTQKRVLKILTVNNLIDEKYIDRFLQEYELIEQLNVPNIIKIFHHGITDEFLYMVMEYLPDGNLKAKIETGVAPETALIYLYKLANGLSAIHGCGVIHRDIKPSNIMFRGDEPVIIDFGISKLTTADVTKTYDDQVMGTPFYMSPEQGSGKGIDFRSDIYSLGVSFYEMLTGRKPYDGDNPLAIVYKHIHEPIPELPDDLALYQPLIEGIMAKDTGTRFQTCRELIKYIQAKYPVPALL